MRTPSELIVLPVEDATLGELPESQALARRTSVVVVAYNAGDFLRDCIASIYSTQPEVEVVLVDNASTDGMIGRAKEEFPEINVIRSARNAGFGAGNNLGVAHTQRDFVIFLNPDTVVTGGWLEALACPLAEDPTVGLVTPKVLRRDQPDSVNVAGLNVHLSGISMCRGLGLPGAALDEVAEVAAISGVAFAARREVYEAIGGFDEDFFLYLEDVDLSLRTWLAGHRCLYVPEPVVLHDYDEVEMGTQKTFWVERGRYLMLLKSFTWRTLLGLLPTLLLAEVITWGWLLWRNPKAVIQKLRAYGWVLANCGQIAEKRRRVQTRRACLDAVFLARCQWHLDFAQLAGPWMARVARAVFAPLLCGASQTVWFAAGSCPKAEDTTSTGGWKISHDDNSRLHVA
jgi:GT2 family glycosyltransferase